MFVLRKSLSLSHTTAVPMEVKRSVTPNIDWGTRLLVSFELTDDGYRFIK